MYIKFESFTTFETLVCCLCEGWLSVAPVYIIPNVGYVCGRCQGSVPPGTLLVNRQTAYEALAENMEFPCINCDSGCNVRLCWNEVVKHEQQCIYKIIHCPIQAKIDITVVSCKWVGTCKTLYEHFKQDHGEHLLNPPEFTLNLENEKPKLFFITAVSQHFVVYMKYVRETQKLYGIVLTLADISMKHLYRYQFELWDNKNVSSVIIRRTDVDQLTDIKENVGDINKLVQIDISATKVMLNNPESILCKIGITKKPNSTAKVVPAPQVLDVSTASKLKEISPALENFECPICSEYMIPPIYVCGTGHSICKICRPRLLVCPSCQCPLQNTRNFAMEKLAATLNYPCQNQAKGCTFIDTYDKVAIHEYSCMIDNTSRCVLKCSWTGSVLDMVKHLISAHPKDIFYTNKLIRRNLADSITTTYQVFSQDDEVFRFACKHSTTTGPVKFAVQHFTSLKSTYKFVLSFIDQTNQGMIFSINHSCYSFTELPSDSFKKCIALPLDVLEPFICNQVLFFTITIERVLQ